jgi:hypothetical protein
MGLSTLALAWTGSVLATGVALFGLGLGWSFSYVAATSELVDLARPAERGRLVGFNDLLLGATGAGLALLGGLAYSHAGRNSVARRRSGGHAARTLDHGHAPPAGLAARSRGLTRRCEVLAGCGSLRGFRPGALVPPTAVLAEHGIEEPTPCKTLRLY